VTPEGQFHPIHEILERDFLDAGCTSGCWVTQAPDGCIYSREASFLIPTSFTIYNNISEGKGFLNFLKIAQVFGRLGKAHGLGLYPTLLASETEGKPLAGCPVRSFR